MTGEQETEMWACMCGGGAVAYLVERTIGHPIGQRKKSAIAIGKRREWKVLGLSK